MRWLSYLLLICPAIRGTAFYIAHALLQVGHSVLAALFEFAHHVFDGHGAAVGLTGIPRVAGHIGWIVWLAFIAWFAVKWLAAIFVKAAFAFATIRALAVTAFTVEAAFAALTGLTLRSFRFWLSLFDGQADLAVLSDVDDFYLYHVAFFQELVDVLYIRVGHLGNVNHTGFAFLQFNKSAELGDTCYFTFQNFSDFYLHTPTKSSLIISR